MNLLRNLSFIALATFPLVSNASEVTPQGHRLGARLDALNVEEHWHAGEHVDWRTGDPDGRPEKPGRKATHCSAFVASAAEQLGVYILRPPEHGLVLLANAQYEWLGEGGASQGWRIVADGVDAQSRANHGDLVVAVYRNHHDDKPGHIAIVRPADKSEGEIREEGPQVIQAGNTNYRSTSLRRGFAGHPAAWDHDEVRYYSHPIDWSALPQ